MDSMSRKVKHSQGDDDLFTTYSLTSQSSYLSRSVFIHLGVCVNSDGINLHRLELELFV